MGRRKRVKEEPIVEQINEQVIEEDTAKQAESEIEFLIKILNRQFELVGVPYTTEELIEMDQETQAKALDGYKLTDDLYNEWYNYFVESTKDNFLFNGLNESDLQNIFTNIVDEWGLDFEPDAEYNEESELEAEDNEDE